MKLNPIKTDEGEPRLLLVTVDVQLATTVTFDSYGKKEKQMMSVYRDEENKEKHIIRYQDGIKMEHLLTSMSSHLRYKFPELKVISISTMKMNICMKIMDNHDHSWMVFILVILHLERYCRLIGIIGIK